MGFRLLEWMFKQFSNNKESIQILSFLRKRGKDRETTMKLIMLCTLVFHSCKDISWNLLFFHKHLNTKMHKSSFHTNSPTYQNSLICVCVCFQITHTIKVRTLLSTHYKSLRVYPSCHRDIVSFGL